MSSGALVVRQAARLWLVVCAAGGAAAAAPSPMRAQGAAAASAAHADSAVLAAVAETIERSRAKGIPVEPLYDKVREGVLKRASTPAIQGAVAALASRLEVARDALAPTPRTAEIIAGADALKEGVPRDALSRVRTAGAPRPVEVPLGVLAQLVSKGVPVPHATEMVVELVSRRTPAAQIVALSRDVEADVAAGIPANAALDLRMRGIRAPLQPQPTAVGDAFGPATMSGGGRSGTTAKPKKP